MFGLSLWLAICRSGPPGVSLPAICEMIEVERGTRMRLSCCDTVIDIHHVKIYRNQAIGWYFKATSGPSAEIYFGLFTLHLFSPAKLFDSELRALEEQEI